MNQRHILLLLLLPTVLWADDPCASLLAVLNRPTVADSVCAVKPDQVILEAGVQYQTLYPGEGTAINLPELQTRFGLPAGNEITVLLPLYVIQYGLDEPVQGVGATSLGFKHQFPVRGQWIWAAEGLVTLPSGSEALGSDGTGAAVNGIVNYTFNSALSLAFMLGVTTATTSSSAGGERYTSVNPDLVFTWQINDVFQWYAEAYGQSKTGPHQTDGYNADTGFQYLPLEFLELDIEYGQRISGELGGFQRYIGVGGGIRF